ncbi:MAG: ABC transporter substrate-binding protein [Cellvibrionales bacterium]|nr:ABC transporter substrate-binding protein [Cellvibrionales bacterium]
MKTILFIIVCFLPLTSNGKVQVQSCNRWVSFDAPPKRAVSNDINMTEMLFALGVQSNMAGYAGITGWHIQTEAFKKQSGSLLQIAEKYPNMEHLLAIKADFFFAGWNYGLTQGGELTPDSLNKFGIKTYELSESCSHIMKKNPGSFEDIYNDIANLGKIFHKETVADTLNQQFKSQIHALQQQIAQRQSTIPVFIYDSGKDAPFTGGKYAIAQAMISSAGGINVTEHLNANWGQTDWESVAKANPEAIIIVNYGTETSQDKQSFLVNLPVLKETPAIKKQHFFVLEYNEITPGIRVFNATERLAKFLHPALFARSGSTEQIEP